METNLFEFPKQLCTIMNQPPPSPSYLSMWFMDAPINVFNGDAEFLNETTFIRIGL